jgi:hypothetical protein
MPFDPSLPADHSPLVSAEMRAQLNGLKALIDAIPGVTSAVVDSVTTVDPGEPANVTLSIVGSVLHLSLAIPQGQPGQQGLQGIPGGAGADGAAALVAVTIPGTVAVGTGFVSFGFATPPVNLGWLTGTRLRAAAVADPANWMEGSIVALGPTEVTLSVDATGGAGSFTGWNLSLAGAQGAPGEVSSAAMNGAIMSAIAGTSNNTNAVATLDTPFTNDPLSLADGELLRAKINELVLAARR